MRIRSKKILLLCLLLAFPFASSADETVSIKAGYLSLSPDGVFAGRDKGAGVDIDFEDDVDFDDTEEFFAEAALQLWRFRLAASYTPLDFTGTSTLDRTITFNGRSYGINDTVKGEIDVDLYDLGLTFYLINMDDLPVRFQLGIEVAGKVIDGSVRLSDVTAGIREEVSGTAGVPTVGGRVRLGISDLLGIAGRVGYAEYDDNTFLDADGQIEFSPLPLVGIFAGYRYLDIDIDESDIILDARFEGPYGGAFVRF